MANLNAPRGFVPVRKSNGRPYLYNPNRYYVTGQNIYVGDPVIRVTASSDPLGGPMVAPQTSTSTGAITGVVVGFDPIESNLGQVGYMTSAQSGYCYVDDDPDTVFEVQESGASTALAITNVGDQIGNGTTGSGSTTIGCSGYTISNAALAGGNTWQIYSLSPKANNVVGQYCKWWVVPNLHTEVNAGSTNRSQI